MVIQVTIGKIDRCDHHLKSYGNKWHIYRAVQKWENQLAKDILNSKEELTMTSSLDLIQKLISLKPLCQAIGLDQDGKAMKNNMRRHRSNS